MSCIRKTGRETVTFEWTLYPPRVCHKAVGKVDIHIRFRGGSSALAIPFSIAEANMISLMNVMDRREGER